MLKTALIHPEILEALAACGHGSKVLIADGDYPVSTTAGVNARIVHLNLRPGMVEATDVLGTLLKVLCVEGAQVMDVPTGDPKPAIWDTYQEMFKQEGVELTLGILERFAFYDEVAKDNTALIIQTGETRDYANLLLTVGSLW